MIVKTPRRESNLMLLFLILPVPFCPIIPKLVSLDCPDHSFLLIAENPSAQQSTDPVPSDLRPQIITYVRKLLLRQFCFEIFNCWGNLLERVDYDVGPEKLYSEIRSSVTLKVFVVVLVVKESETEFEQGGQAFGMAVFFYKFSQIQRHHKPEFLLKQLNLQLLQQSQVEVPKGVFTSHPV